MPQLTVDATLDSLGEIGRYLQAASADAGLTKSQAYNLRLAVDEVATNNILHGYEENGLTGSVVVRTDVTGDAFTVTLEDTSPEFDPRSRKVPSEEDLAAPLEDRNIGGLGIFLAFKSVDEFRYERHGDKNYNIFVVRRGAPS
jgi:anti-sigma regulatory factor (Ser/Thr protein kinase)